MQLQYVNIIRLIIQHQYQSVVENVLMLSVARAGTVRAGQVLRDGTERERTSHAALPGMERPR